MKRLLFIIIATLGAIGLSAAETASDVLSKSIDKIKTAGSFTATCVLHSGGSAENGQLTMSGKSFRIEAKKFGVWYDGKTQWTYSAASNEVNVTEPDTEELAQINPLSVIDYFRQNYTATFGTQKNGVKTVILQAKKKGADIKRADIQINSSTMMPIGVDLILSNGQKIAVTISNLKTGKALPSSTFRYDKKYHPGAEIVDLR